MCIWTIAETRRCIFHQPMLLHENWRYKNLPIRASINFTAHYIELASHHLTELASALSIPIVDDFNPFQICSVFSYSAYWNDSLDARLFIIFYGAIYASVTAMLSPCPAISMSIHFPAQPFQCPAISMYSHFCPAISMSSHFCPFISLPSHFYVQPFLCPAIPVRSFPCQAIFMSSHFPVQPCLCPAIFVPSHFHVLPYLCPATSTSRHFCPLISMSSRFYVQPFMFHHFYVPPFLCPFISTSNPFRYLVIV